MIPPTSISNACTAFGLKHAHGRDEGTRNPEGRPDFGLYEFVALHGHAADGGWINTNDDPDPWSDPVSGTIPKV